MGLMRFGVWRSKHWFGVRIGAFYFTLRGPDQPMLFSERNGHYRWRVCLPRNWRLVVKK